MKKKIDIVKQLLTSGDEDFILDQLLLIRQTGTVSLLPGLALLAIETKSPKVKNEVLSIFRDIKDKNAAGTIVLILQNPAYRILRKDILSCCWESSIDFGDYLADFVNIFNSCDDETAIEVFTLIGNATHYPTSEVISQQVEMLIKAKKDMSEMKKSLADDLIRLLRQV